MAEKFSRFSKLDLAVVKLYQGNKAIGTGFSVNGSYIVTNYHVVKKFIETQRTGENFKEKLHYMPAFAADLSMPIIKYEANIVEDLINNDTIYNYAKYTDLAILKTKIKNHLKVQIPLSKDFIYRGDEIVVAGFPLNLNFLVVTWGKIGGWGFLHDIPEDIQEMISISGVHRGQGDYITAPGGSGGPVIRVGNSIEEDSIVGVASSGYNIQGDNILDLYGLYVNKLDSIRATGKKVDDSDPKYKNIFEKAVIYSRLVNSNSQVPIFIHVSHVNKLLEMLGIKK